MATAMMSGGAAQAADWPQWRGPNRDGKVATAAWPAKLDAQALKQAWRVPLAPSYSSPIVSGGRVFTTETKDRQFEIVTAYDRKTGKLLWRAEWEGAMSVPFFAKSNGDWIRATPACDGESLFVAGMCDVLVCLDVKTGKERWRLDFVKKFGTPLPGFGFVSSPLLDGDAVYVQAGASFVKVNKKNGAILWRTLKDDGGMWGSVFSSPIITTLAGKRQLVVQTREKLVGVDPQSGAPLWEQKIESFRGMCILTPVVYKDIVFSSSYGGKTLGLKVTQSNGKFTVATVWQHRSQAYMTTPVVLDGVAYIHLKSQRAMAIDMETGKEHWTTEQSFGQYWSLVGQGNRILALDQRGELLLLAATPAKFELLDRRKLTDSPTWAHLVVADDEVFVRELNALVCYKWKAKAKG